MWCESEQMVAPTRERLQQVAGGDRPHVTVEPAFSSKPGCDDVVVVVVPSSQVESVARQIEQAGQPYPLIVTASKGLERSTFRTMSQVIGGVLPDATIAVLSGPNIAREIADGRPAKAMLGCEDVNALLNIAKMLGSDRFHLDVTRDKVDLELCAAMKGVFAIGAGIISARQMGCNFMGLLLTFGLREITEIARFLGISSSHVFGVAGLGDLVATCFSPDSRNYRLGELLASGRPLQEALDEVQMVVEGAMTASAVAEMTALRLHLPLFAAIARVVESPSEESVAHFEYTLLEYPTGSGQ
jgi:glycerol-3-phosphate dehydrogenase (NAD(P)+)